MAGERFLVPAIAVTQVTQPSKSDPVKRTGIPSTRQKAKSTIWYVSTSIQAQAWVSAMFSLC